MCHAVRDSNFPPPCSPPELLVAELAVVPREAGVDLGVGGQGGLGDEPVAAHGAEVGLEEEVGNQYTE